MARNEKQTREELIDPSLRLAGWDVLTTDGEIQKGKACIETPVNNMPISTINPRGNGYVDYVLFGDDGKPLALIEAKKAIINEEQGRVQACLYADCLEKIYGVRPIVYYTNGYSVKIIDGLYPARQVFSFHRKDELEYLIQRRDNFLNDRTINTDICGRYYQKDAIDEVLKYMGTKHSRSLIVLATGTGKTRVSCALSDIFIRNNFVKRVLFLADRKNLVKQAKEETFEKFLPTVPMASIVEGKKEGDESKARIVFSTYQSMLSIIKDLSTCPYGIGHFDLIIVDEAHRSLFNKYAEIFTYFDALMIGLTATPRNDIHKSTYKVFDLDKEAPNYEYDLVKGVKDGYLTYYRALDRTPDILKDGVTYDDLSDDEKEEYEELFTEEDGTLPEKIEGKEFYSVITNKDTIRKVLSDLMNEGIYVDNGDRLGKTIIFARDHNHAIMIQDEFRKMYPELCNPTAVNGVDYCVVIDNKIKHNEVLQREFKNKQDIRIVISVDMMDTGVDIPEVVNLVFFKRVLSKIKFWQMVGRGTRLCSDIKALSPSKAYFERLTNDTERQLYNDKQGFLIFDICNVFPFFKLYPDGRKDSSEQALSLYQKLFVQKVALVLAMQNNYAKLDVDNKKYFEELRQEQCDEVKNLNRNYIGVKNNLKYVEKYSDIGNWYDLKKEDFTIIKKNIAPNVVSDIEADGIRSFDYLCYKFATGRLSNDKDFKASVKALFVIANYLLNVKIHIEEVSKQKDNLEYMISDEFLTKSTSLKIDYIRENVRELIRYIERDIFEPIISDFRDEISSRSDAIDIEEVDFSVTVDDFKTLDEKTIFLIHNEKSKLVECIYNLIKPSETDVKEFKEKIQSLAKTSEEYINMFPDDDSLIAFIRKNVELNPVAINQFLSKMDWLNTEQTDYIRELFLFISQNGRFVRKDLLREELNFNSIFNNIQIIEVIEKIEEVL